MSIFRIDPDNVRTAAASLEEIKNELVELRSSIESGRNSLLTSSNSMWVIEQTLNGIIRDINSESLSTKRLSIALKDIAHLYEQVDKKIMNEVTDTREVIFRENKENIWSHIRDWFRRLLELFGFISAGDDEDSIFISDPVNVCTGNYISAVTEITYAGIPSLSFLRYYNSLYPDEGRMGIGWSHNYEIKLIRENDYIDVINGDKHTERYYKVDEDVFISRHNRFNCVTKDDGYTLFMHDGNVYRFDTSGQIQIITAKNGRKLFFEHKEGKLLRAYDEAGRSLLYCYDEEGLLTSVSDTINRKVELFYEDGLLTGVVSADGRKKVYTYDEAGRLVRIYNNAGTCIICNEFDNENRVVKQYFPDDTEMTFSYDDLDVIVTDRNGAVTTYRHNERFQITDEIRTDGTQHYAYDENNLRVSFTDSTGALFTRKYDSEGNVISITDAAGESVTLSYERKGLPSVILERNGGITRREYDSLGNVVRYEDPLGNETTFSYENGDLVKIIYPDSSCVRFIYDDKGYLIARTDEMENAITFSYDDAGRLISRTDPRGMKSSYTYDPCNRLLSETNPLGQVRTYEYSLTGKIAKITDFDGFAEEYEYNELGLCCSKTDKEGRTTELAYDANGNLSEIILPNGSRILHEYDEYNRLIGTVNELGLRTEYAYDGDGRLIRKSDNRLVTTIEYDSCGRAIKIAEMPADGNDNALTHEKLVTRDAEGRITGLTCPDGRTYAYRYDLLGRCIEKEDPLGIITAYSYNKRGKLLSINRGGKELRRYCYYPNGKLREMRSFDGNRIRYEYDASGNRTGIKYNTGYEILYEYDELNRRVKMSDSSGRKVSYTYDRAGRISTHTDAIGNSSEYIYSPTGRLIGVKDALGNAVSYKYDQMDQLVEIYQGDYTEDYSGDNGLGNRISFERNAKGLITGISDIEGNKSSFVYNVYGEMIRRTTPEQVQTDFEYNAFGKNTAIYYSDGRTVRMSYDMTGRLTEMEDWNGLSSVEYDPLGRIAAVRDFDGHKVSYEWDILGGRTAMHYPDGNSVYYDADDLGRLSKIRTESGEFSYFYDEAGRLSGKKAPNGSAEYEYYCDGKAKSLVISDKMGKASELDLTYDLRGNISKKNEWIREKGAISTEYEYDPLNRIEKVTENGSVVRRYKYDRFGNQVLLEENGKKTRFAYNRLNQLIRREVSDDNKSSVTRWEYNKDGHVVLEKTEVDGSENKAAGNIGHNYAFRYDSASRMSEVVRSDGMHYAYEYDGFGMRRSRVSHYVTDKGIYEERNCPEREHKSFFCYDYTASHTPLIARFENDSCFDYIRDGELAGLLNGKKLGTYFCDPQGSVRSFYLNNGDSPVTYRYDEYGNENSDNANMVSESIQPFGYAGMLWDAGSHTYMTQARMYTPENGRFMMKDEERFIHLSNPQSINLYTYCLGNPVMYVDPDGNDCYYFYLPEWENEALTDQRLLAEKYGYDIDQVHLIPITNDQELTDGWNAMGTVNGERVDIDTVVINTHANPYVLGYGSNSTDRFSTDDAYALQDKTIDELILYGCNAGHRDYADENIANAFSHKVNNAPVMASDGTVYGQHSDDTYEPRNDDEFQRWAEQAGNGGRDNEGWQVYQQVDGRTVVTNTGIKRATVIAMMKLISRNRLKGIRE